MQRKKETHVFKWVDEALVDEIQKVEAKQGRITEAIEDLKMSMKKTVEEEVRKQKNPLNYVVQESFYGFLEKRRMNEISLLVLSILLLTLLFLQ